MKILAVIWKYIHILKIINTLSSTSSNPPNNAIDIAIEKLNVIGDVHLGDWGIQMGMVISEVERRNPSLPYFDESFTGEYPTEAPFTIDELEDIYPYASKLAKSDEAVMEAAKKATVELQQGRRGYVALWKHILNV